jgi:nucleotide-binding universal stress UspA family protein
MKKVLLVISTTGYSPEAVAHALKITRESAGNLYCCYIIDQEIPDAVSSWLIYLGFMGDEPSEDYRNVILAEYKSRAKESLAEISQLASKEGIKTESFIIKGPLVVETIKLATEIGADVIVIDKPAHAYFSRTMHGSAIEKLKKEAACPVEVIGN